MTVYLIKMELFLSLGLGSKIMLQADIKWHLKWRAE